MSNVPFTPFSKAVFNRINEMSKQDLFVVDIDPYELQDIYLDSFPAGTNEIFRERREYDCSCCKNFIRKMGNVVTVKNGKVESVWDVDVPYPFDVVCAKLSEVVKSVAIKTVFLHNESRVGTEYNHEKMPDGEIKRWNHFYCDIDSKFISNSVAEKRSEIESSVGVFLRGLEELSIDALETVKDLIADKSIYRGEEHSKAVNSFVKLKKVFNKLTSDNQKNLFIWENYKDKSVRFKNSVIGTLVSDISDGVDLEKAVKSFESKVAPENYKRSSSLITKRMIDDAMKTVDKLGIEDSLYRKHATVDEVDVNDIIWANRITKTKMKGGLSDLLMEEVTPKTVDTSKVTDISIDDFIGKVVPTCTNIKLLVSNSHIGNFMTITSPAISGSKNIFKWDNNHAWSYNGDITDSTTKQMVINAGGRVDGVFRFSHSWNHNGKNQSLMDLHVFMPLANGKASVHTKNPINDNYGAHDRIGWQSGHRKHHKSGGVQDVDFVNEPNNEIPVENTTFPTLDRIPNGDYVCKIHNWKSRKNPTEGGRAEIEVGGSLYEYEYGVLKHKEWLTLATVTKNDSGFTIKHYHPTGKTSKDVWGIKTEEFVDVNMLMLSPNHWGDNEVGNKHHFFIIKDCKNPDSLRGIYNEFLSNDLNKYRKVFEVLGSKTKCEYSDNQLSGLGFSSTKQDNVIVKVEGNKNMMYNVIF